MIFEAFISVPSNQWVGEMKFGCEGPRKNAAKRTAAFATWKQWDAPSLGQRYLGRGARTGLASGPGPMAIGGPASSAAHAGVRDELLTSGPGPGMIGGPGSRLDAGVRAELTSGPGPGTIGGPGSSRVHACARAEPTSGPGPGAIGGP